MNSVWVENATRAYFNSLKESVKTDVLIIGGGITGILCAYMLRRAGVDCIVVEAKQICSGITQNTTAKITVGHGLIYDKLIKQFGVGNAQLFLSAQMRAAEEYANLCRNIECDYEKKDSYVYSLCDRAKI